METQFPQMTTFKNTFSCSYEHSNFAKLQKYPVSSTAQIVKNHFKHLQDNRKKLLVQRLMTKY
jgi:hypothetical protein